MEPPDPGNLQNGPVAVRRRTTKNRLKAGEAALAQFLSELSQNQPLPTEPLV